MMIKINLLPIQGKGPTKIYTQLGLMGIILVLCVFTILFLWFRQTSDIDAKNTEIHLKNKKVQELQETNRKVEDFKKKRELVKQKLSVIERGRKYQRAAVQIMMEALQVLPDQVWLGSWTMENQQFKADGYALSLTSIGNFLTALQESPLFKNVHLIQTVKQRIVNHDIFFFNITYSLDLDGLDVAKNAQ